MSTSENLISWREMFERIAAAMLYIATAAVVAGGAFLMCFKPFLH
jgi:hypothetical protein